MKNQRPELVIEEYFLGKTWAWGLFEDRFGTIRQCFKVEMNGLVEGNQLTLDEQFFYEDGTGSKRLWKINALGNGFYEGTAGDVAGTAKGQSSGNAFEWTYMLDLPVSGRTWRVKLDDRLYLQEDDKIINIARVSKWGFHLGRLTFFFSKEMGVLNSARPLI
ncbi:DUF3833 domain-containing protein [Sansalvadorimonas verongulae]|nr:DUF3833 domain-containing protein [Sansalvadorimonas verongulae]